MKKVAELFKKELMLTVSLLAALVSFVITPPSVELFKGIDWRTLATLFMLLSVLDGFKQENLFRPVLKLSGKIQTQIGMTFFLIFGVFFSSMFVTNDVSLIIFVPLTIILFRAGDKEEYILPVIAMENIAAVRGSLLTPFGSPQNLFLYAKSGISITDFLWMMFPLWVGSAVLLPLFIAFLYRKQPKEQIDIKGYKGNDWAKEKRPVRIAYYVLFFVILCMIVSRTKWWPIVLVVVIITLLIFDPAVFKRVDYALILTFLCFFVFSSAIASNETIAAFMHKSVGGHEYWWSIGISQVISNVPASIALWPFTDNLKPLIYGLDTAGLVTVIGSLASVINMRIYVKEYPGRGKDFLKTFEIVSLAFFVIIVIPQWLMLSL